MDANKNRMDTTQLLFKDLAYDIIGLAMQVHNLKATGMELAIILNFGKEKLEYERLVFQRRKKIREN